MSAWIKRFVTSLGLRKQEVAILVIGLDNSGKTTLIRHFSPKVRAFQGKMNAISYL